MKFKDKLERLIAKNNTLLCVGLDTDLNKISEKNQFLFNKKIIKATYDLVCSYKLNTAFYEAMGLEGIKALKKTCDFIRANYPDIPIIIDAKRGDIGNTNKGYVQFVFTYLEADAVTINPYLGEEAIRPFLEQKDKGIIILCRTSNKGAFEFQDLKTNNVPLYQTVAKNVSQKWNVGKNCLLVVGATYPEEIEKIRKIVGQEMYILVPGVGAQGGDLEKTLNSGLNNLNTGLIINSSRAIIYAKNPRQATLDLKNQINNYR